VDLIEDNVNGLLVPANDHEALADALLRLISSEGERTAFGRRARHVVGRDYDIENVAERYMQVYLALLESKPSDQAAGPKCTGLGQLPSARCTERFDTGKDA